MLEKPKTAARSSTTAGSKSKTGAASPRATSGKSPTSRSVASKPATPKPVTPKPAASAPKSATRYAWSKEDRRASSTLKRLYLAAKEADQLTHMKLAQSTGINRSLVSQHLAELAPIGLEAAKSYAKFFKVDIGMLHPKYKDLHIVSKPPRGYAPAPTDWRLYQRDRKIVVVHGGREYLVTDL